MSNKKDLTLIQRERALIRLIKDAIAFNYSQRVIEEYKSQLKSVQKEIKEEKEEKLKFKNENTCKGVNENGKY